MLNPISFLLRKVAKGGSLPTGVIKVEDVREELNRAPSERQSGLWVTLQVVEEDVSLSILPCTERRRYQL